MNFVGFSDVVMVYLLARVLNILVINLFFFFGLKGQGTRKSVLSGIEIDGNASTEQYA